MISWLDSTFDMDEVYQLRDGEITRKGDKAAFVSYDVAHHGESYRSGFNRIRVYRMTGPPPARPEACFYLDGPDQPDLMSSPSFSPDGSKLVWQYGGGISIADIPDLSGGCQAPATVQRPGDRRRAARLGPGGRAGGERPELRPAGRAEGHAEPEQLMLKLPKRLKLAKALRKGITLTVNAGAAGKARATAKLKRSKVGSGVATVGASGKAKVRIRFSRKAARSLRKRRSVRLAIAVGFKPVAGAPVKRSASLTLKR